MSPVTVLATVAFLAVVVFVARCARRDTRQAAAYDAWVTRPVIHGTPLPPGPVPRSVAWAVDHNARADALAAAAAPAPERVAS